MADKKVNQQSELLKSMLGTMFSGSLAEDQSQDIGSEFEPDVADCFDFEEGLEEVTTNRNALFTSAKLDSFSGYIEVDDASSKYDIPKRTLRRWLKDGKVSGVLSSEAGIPGHKRWLITETDLKRMKNLIEEEVLIGSGQVTLGKPTIESSVTTGSGQVTLGNSNLEDRVRELEIQVKLLIDLLGKSLGAKENTEPVYPYPVPNYPWQPLVPPVYPSPYSPYGPYDGKPIWVDRTGWQTEGDGSVTAPATGFWTTNGTEPTRTGQESL